MVSNAIHHTHHPHAGALHQVRNDRNYAPIANTTQAMLSSTYYAAAAAAIVNNPATNHLLIHHPDYSSASLLAPNAAALAHHIAPNGYNLNNNSQVAIINGFHPQQAAVQAQSLMSQVQSQQG